MGLNEYAVDLFEIDDADLVAHGFDEAAQAQVAGAAQEAFAGADDQGQRLRREGVVAQAGAVELAQDEPVSGNALRSFIANVGNVFRLTSIHRVSIEYSIPAGVPEFGVRQSRQP